MSVQQIHVHHTPTVQTLRVVIDVYVTMASTNKMIIDV